MFGSQSVILFNKQDLLFLSLNCFDSSVFDTLKMESSNYHIVSELFISLKWDCTTRRSVYYCCVSVRTQTNVMDCFSKVKGADTVEKEGGDGWLCCPRGRHLD